MGNHSAAWYVMALLLLLSALMTSHLMSLWVAVNICKDYADVLIQRAASSADYRIEDAQNSCSTLEVTFGDAVDKYLSVILSLIGGAAVSGGVAASVNRRDDDQ